MPRGTCGSWTAGEMTAYMVANGTIALSYFAISLILAILIVVGRQPFPRRWESIGFTTFIFSCGLGHAIGDVAVFWYPNYHLFIVIDSCTAALSVGVAVTLPFAIKEIVRRPSFNQLREAYHKTMAIQSSLQNAALDAAGRNQRLLQATERLGELTSTLADLMSDGKSRPNGP